MPAEAPDPDPGTDCAALLRRFRLAGITNPPLSVMRHPLFEMGQLAAQKLLERLDEASDREGRAAAEYETIRLPIELIRRESF